MSLNEDRSGAIKDLLSNRTVLPIPPPALRPVHHDERLGSCCAMRAHWSEELVETYIGLD